MTVLSAQTIRHRSRMENIIYPFYERAEFDRLTYGLGPAGYDVTVDSPHEAGIHLNPGFHLFSTIEYITLPDDLLAVIHDKSTWARRNISVKNTIVDPGFRGYLTLEVTNGSDITWFLPQGTPIAQLVFHKLDEPTEEPYCGKYQYQEQGPQEAR